MSCATCSVTKVGFSLMTGVFNIRKNNISWQPVIYIYKFKFCCIRSLSNNFWKFSIINHFIHENNTGESCRIHVDLAVSFFSCRLSISHFTVVCLVTWPLNWRDTGVDNSFCFATNFTAITTELILLWSCLTVQIQKPSTQELFLECYCVARKKPIRYKMKKPQAVTVIRFVACGFWSLIWLVIAQLKCHRQIIVFTVFGFAQ